MVGAKNAACDESLSWDGATLALSLILGRAVVIGRAVAECVLLSGLWSTLW